jgi:putative transcriptional regulator
MAHEKSFEDALIASLEEALAHKHGEVTLRTRVAERPAAASPLLPPPQYDGARVRALRERLNISQQLFASLLNVSDGTVKAWEQDRRRPEGPSLRLLEIVEEYPETFLAKLRRTG